MKQYQNIHISTCLHMYMYICIHVVHSLLPASVGRDHCSRCNVITVNISAVSIYEPWYAVLYLCPMSHDMYVVLYACLSVCLSVAVSLFYTCYDYKYICHSYNDTYEGINPVARMEAMMTWSASYDLCMHKTCRINSKQYEKTIHFSSLFSSVFSFVCVFVSLSAPVCLCFSSLSRVLIASLFIDVSVFSSVTPMSLYRYLFQTLCYLVCLFLHASLTVYLSLCLRLSELLLVHVYLSVFLFVHPIVQVEGIEKMVRHWDTE